MNNSILPVPSLDVLIHNELHRQITMENDFTAYSITMNLRNDNPNIPIPHAVVQDYVHSVMGGKWLHAFYEDSKIVGYSMIGEYFNGNIATSYKYTGAPVMGTAIVGVIPAPVQPQLSSGTVIDWKDDE